MTSIHKGNKKGTSRIASTEYVPIHLKNYHEQIQTGSQHDSTSTKSNEPVCPQEYNQLPKSSGLGCSKHG